MTNLYNSQWGHKLKKPKISRVRNINKTIGTESNRTAGGERAPLHTHSGSQKELNGRSSPVDCHSQGLQLQEGGGQPLQVDRGAFTLC